MAQNVHKLTSMFEMRYKVQTFVWNIFIGDTHVSSAEKYGRLPDMEYQYKQNCMRLSMGLSDTLNFETYCIIVAVTKLHISRPRKDSTPLTARP
jgi:hypothetical protein